MKAVSKLVLLLSLSALGCVVANASTPEQTYIDSYRKDSNTPVPVAVVTPTVGPEYAGSTVEIAFVVDQAGMPADLSVKSAADDALGSLVLDAVKQWRFKPAMHNGAPIATKVVLPVRIVEPAFDGSVVASN
ncbi:MAG TPA: TonB family protein [Opitutaceae bacterium]|nr:TonB family protein [Opitutaceae bacterium]